MSKTFAGCKPDWGSHEPGPKTRSVVSSIHGPDATQPRASSTSRLERREGGELQLLLTGPERWWYAYHAYAPDVAEQLSDGTILVISGNANTGVLTHALRGTLGSIRRVTGFLTANPKGEEVAGCSGRFPFVFTR